MSVLNKFSSRGVQPSGPAALFRLSYAAALRCAPVKGAQTAGLWFGTSCWISGQTVCTLSLGRCQICLQNTATLAMASCTDMDAGPVASDLTLTWVNWGFLRFSAQPRKGSFRLELLQAMATAPSRPRELKELGVAGQQLAGGLNPAAWQNPAQKQAVSSHEAGT